MYDSVKTAFLIFGTVCKVSFCRGKTKITTMLKMSFYQFHNNEVLLSVSVVFNPTP